MASVPPDPGPWLERLDEIRDTGDRRATLDLTALLCDPGARLDEESLDDIAETLCALEDLRCRPALERVMLNRTASRDVRLAALRVLGCLPFNDPPHATVLEYARDPDDIVRAYGASFLEPVDEERLAAAIGDPAVLVRRAAAESLVASARTPRLVAALRAGLRDSDALVREIATRAALFDEPLAATYDLLHLLDDVDTDVRCSVYDALEDFPSVSVMLALADARSGPEGPLAEAALDLLLTRVRATLEGAANESGAPPERLRRWAAPVRWLLDEPRPPVESVGAFDVESAGADADEPPRADGRADGRVEDWVADGDLDDDAAPIGQRPPVDLADARSILLDPDASPLALRSALVGRDWSGTGPPGVDLLRRVAASPAWSLRHGAAVALLDVARARESRITGAATAAIDALLGLATDVEAVVRRIALHALTHVGEARAVPVAEETLAAPRLRPLAGDAALHAVVALGSRDAAETALRAELAVANDRDGLLLGAIHLAERLASAATVADLVRIAQSPVVGGVSVHVAALRALRSLAAHQGGSELTCPGPDLAHLEGLDHLDVQAELAAWDWRGPRYG